MTLARRARRWRTLPRATLLAATLSLSAPNAAQDFPHTPADYLRMLDSNGDGKVDEAEYVQYMSGGFRRMDSNGDGVLATSELPGNHGKPITLPAFQDNLRRQFHRLDRNHDGYLDAKELTQPPR